MTDWIEKEVEIQNVKTLLAEGYEIEVDSPDGWVGVNFFVDKGMYEEFVLTYTNGYNGTPVRCNEAHLFETTIGWASASQLVNKEFNVLTRDGYQKATVRKTHEQIPIVDINVEHENHRYYTEQVSSHNTGVGKSLAMCHFAAAAMSEGKNVLYITLEMAEEKIAERIDANLFDIDIADIENLPKSAFDTKINKIKTKTSGKLIVKEYPTAVAHVGHFRALLEELKLKKDFKPDIIFIDYLNIAASSRMKGLGGAINSYTYVKAIAEELRGLAVEYNVPLWSATQVNRTGFGSSDVEITDTSECIALTEKVEMRDGGFKMMDEIEIGDQIKANDDYKTVMFRHHNKVKDCIKIKTKSGKEIVVSKDHVFPIKNQDGIVRRLSYSQGLKAGHQLNTKKV